MASVSQLPTGSLVIRRSPTGAPFYEAKWRWDGAQIKRRIGPAWLDPGDNGVWKPRRGRVRDGHFDEKRATVRMAKLVEEHVDGVDRHREHERAERERSANFREVAADWMKWLAEVKRARPSTLRDYASMLAEPGAQHRRGSRSCQGRILAAFGDKGAAEITRRDVSRFLRGLDTAEVSPRTVNKHRQVLSAIFNYAMRDDTFALPGNPVVGTDKRKELPAAALDFFEPQEIEELARAAHEGRHRKPAVGRGGGAIALMQDEMAARGDEDAQDAEMFRVLAYTGLRVGEALALRWGDVDLDRRRIIVQRALSATEEGPTKGWQVRYVPLANPAHDALARLEARQDFTQRDDYVFCSRLGGRLDASAVRRRYHSARRTVGLRHVKLHGLRHGAGSLIARETDAVFVQHFLGHAKLATTERYMHAKARQEDVDKLNRAFGGTSTPARHGGVAPSDLASMPTP